MKFASLALLICTLSANQSFASEIELYVTGTTRFINDDYSTGVVVPGPPRSHVQTETFSWFTANERSAPIALGNNVYASKSSQSQFASDVLTLGRTMTFDASVLEQGKSYNLIVAQAVDTKSSKIKYLANSWGQISLAAYCMTPHPSVPGLFVGNPLGESVFSLDKALQTVQGKKLAVSVTLKAGSCSTNKIEVHFDAQSVNELKLYDFEWTLLENGDVL